ncbi:Uncharacterised protein [Cardiobacterium hominis]|nr:Uncharacterised protein [Cardiobacterium hominis]
MVAHCLCCYRAPSRLYWTRPSLQVFVYGWCRRGYWRCRSRRCGCSGYMAALGDAAGFAVVQAVGTDVQQVAGDGRAVVDIVACTQVQRIACKQLATICDVIARAEVQVAAGADLSTIGDVFARCKLTLLLAPILPALVMLPRACRLRLLSLVILPPPVLLIFPALMLSESTPWICPPWLFTSL